jgi:hypothetical protein
MIPRVVGDISKRPGTTLAGEWEGNAPTPESNLTFFTQNGSILGYALNDKLGQGLDIGSTITTAKHPLSITTPWADATDYVMGDEVTHAGREWVCIEAHTSDAAGGDGTGGPPVYNGAYGHRYQWANVFFYPLNAYLTATMSGHPFAPGDVVYISGAPGNWSGYRTIIATTENTFDFVADVSGGLPESSPPIFTDENRVHLKYNYNFSASLGFAKTDPDGNLYYCSELTADRVLKVTAPTATVNRRTIQGTTWMADDANEEITINAFSYDIMITKDGLYLYYAVKGVDPLLGLTNKVWKYRLSDGAVMWWNGVADSYTRLGVDDDGNVYCGTGTTVVKLAAADGSLSDTYTNVRLGGSSIGDMKVSSYNNVIVTTSIGLSTSTLRLEYLDKSGSASWVYTDTYPGEALVGTSVVLFDGYVYVAGSQGGKANTIYKLDYTLTVVDSETVPDYIDTSPFARDASIQGLYIDVYGNLVCVNQNTVGTANPNMILYYDPSSLDLQASDSTWHGQLGGWSSNGEVFLDSGIAPPDFPNSAFPGTPDAARLIPFVFNTDDSYILVFDDLTLGLLRTVSGVSGRIQE